MKYQLLTLSTLASLSLAQNLSGEPPCATACITSAITAAGCALTDLGCPCGTAQTAISTLIVPCLIKSCPATLLGLVQSAGLALCVQYSAGLTASGGTITTAGTGTATATATATAVTTGTGAVDTGSGLPVSTATASDEGTTGGVTIQTSVPTVTATVGSNSTVTTAKPSTTAAGGASGSRSGSASASATGNSAVGLSAIGLVNGVVVGVLGLIAAL